MKKAYVWIIIFSVLIIICAAFIFTIDNTGGSIAVIKSNGETVKTINLSKVREPYCFNVTHNGHINTVYVENGSIGVQSADCPDKVCVHQGMISNAAAPIVCLPNKLVITVKNASKTAFDAVSGG